MRLQVSIKRHSLPTTRILFKTGSGPSPQTAQDNATIADLLVDLNKVVPLESSDGEWGLEDYVVEAAATADQDHVYECLHYSQINEVLIEEDEVVVRFMTGRDLRERRLGGRIQISSDGRHLVDGITWGRNWIRGDTSRPGVEIPSRKRRRLLMNGDDVDEVPISVNQMTLLGNQHNEADQEEGNLVAEGGQPIQITAAAHYDDYDENDDYQSATDSSNDGSAYSVVHSELSNELKDLIEDAQLELEQCDGDLERLEEVQSNTPRNSKRKRDLEDADGEAHRGSDFEGFSSPANRSSGLLLTAADTRHDREADFNSLSSSTDGDSMLYETRDEQQARNRRNLSPDTNDESSSSSYEEESTSSSGSSDEESPATVESVALSSNVTGHVSREKSLIDSSESTSDSGSSSTSDVENQSLPDAESSSSSSSSSSSISYSRSDQSMSDSTSSNSSTESSSSDGESATAVKLPNPTPKLLEPFKHPLGTTSSTSTDIRSNQSPPGQGKRETHLSNNRTKRRKRLNRLKAHGVLPPDAGFDALEEYDAACAQSQGYSQHGSDDPDVIEEKKAVLLAQMRSSPQVDDAPVNETTAKEPPESLIGAVRQSQEANKESIDDNLAQPASSPDFADAELERPLETSKPRSKLDIASTRRMLFGSLGLKAPKTPAAEQELRERLARDVRKPGGRKDEQLMSEQPREEAEEEATDVQPEVSDRDSWRKKVHLAAVECEVPDVLLQPPPFPFRQGWDTEAKSRMRRNNKVKSRNDAQYDQGAEMEDEGVGYNVSGVDEAVNGVETPTLDSTTISAELANNDDLPIPSDFDTLSSLDANDLNPGSIIAFKELHMTPAGQPEISDYRVARVVAITHEGDVQYILSRRDHDALQQAKFDPDTGERIYSLFEVPDEEEQDEMCGELVKSFSDMLGTKLVERAKVQVTSSDASQLALSQEHITQPQDETAVIPESLPDPDAKMHPLIQVHETIVSQVNIDTPRREEITNMIKDAGSEAAIDETLVQPGSDLQGGTELKRPLRQSAAGRSSRSSAQCSRHTSAESDKNSKKASYDTSGFESPQFPGWSSFSARDKHELPLATSSPVVAANAGVTNYDDDDQWVSTQEPPKVSGMTPKGVTTSAAIDDVTYPHMSQLGLDSSLASHAQSSSHQDAQKVDPFEQDEPDITRLVDEPDPRPDDSVDRDAINGRDDEHQESLRSEIPQSEPRQQSPAPENSFLGGQWDGHNSLLDDHPDSVDSEGLPSLHQILSSSQPPRSSATSSRGTRISPPPLRKGLRNVKLGKTSTSSSEEHNTTPDLKVSASQNQHRSMSQIPDETQVVDLTMSSDPVSPGGSDGEYHQGRRTRGQKKATLGAPKTIAPATQDSTTKINIQELGLGKRKMLISRKARSQI